jgi:hypothetical protein
MRVEAEYGMREAALSLEVERLRTELKNRSNGVGLELRRWKEQVRDRDIRQTIHAILM